MNEKNQRHVLIVSRELIQGMFLQKQLRDLGEDVTLVHYINEALPLVEKKLYDIIYLNPHWIFIDSNQEDTIDIIDWLIDLHQRWPVLKNTPFVAITANDPSTYEPLLYQAGFKGHLMCVYSKEEIKNFHETILKGEMYFKHLSSSI